MTKVSDEIEKLLLDSYHVSSCLRYSINYYTDKECNSCHNRNIVKMHCCVRYLQLNNKTPIYS